MTDCELLKARIAELGLQISFVAEKLGISREGFYLKLNGKTEFKVSEVAALTKILRLNRTQRDAIFFANKGELNSPK